MLKLEKHMPKRTVIIKIPRICRGLREISMRMMSARIRIATAWKIPRIPADKVLPRTIAEREVGVEINLFNCPEVPFPDNVDTVKDSYEHHRLGQNSRGQELPVVGIAGRNHPEIAHHGAENSPARGPVAPVSPRPASSHA